MQGCLDASPQLPYLRLADGALAQVGSAVIEAVEEIAVVVGERLAASSHDRGGGGEERPHVRMLLNLAALNLAKGGDHRREEGAGRQQVAKSSNHRPGIEKDSQSGLGMIAHEGADLGFAAGDALPRDR